MSKLRSPLKGTAGFGTPVAPEVVSRSHRLGEESRKLNRTSPTFVESISNPCVTCMMLLVLGVLCGCKLALVEPEKVGWRKPHWPPTVPPSKSLKTCPGETATGRTKQHKTFPNTCFTGVEVPTLPPSRPPASIQNFRSSIGRFLLASAQESSSSFAGVIDELSAHVGPQHARGRNLLFGTLQQTRVQH